MEGSKSESAFGSQNITFRELQDRETVSVTDVKETLREYATSGAAILGRVVNALIDRVDLTDNDVMDLMDSAKKGSENQARRRFPKDAAEFDAVTRHLQAVRERRMEGAKDESSPGLQQLSFAELEARETFSVAELKKTLREYATSISGISGKVVNALIDRVYGQSNLTDNDIADLIESAKMGSESQTSRRMPIDAAEYDVVVAHLESKRQR